MKKILFAFVGQTRTFEKTYQNIFDNLIIPYKDTYQFDIIIHTENTDDNYLDTKLKNCYNKHNQLKYIHYEILSRQKHKSYEMFGVRVAKVLELEENNKYDYYIFCRLDVVILNKINLELLLSENKFTSISSLSTRPCNTHTHDWDYIWIADYKSMFTFIYSYLELDNNYKYKSKDIEFKQIYQKLNDLKNRDLNEDEISRLRKECGLDGDTSYMNHFKTVYLVLLNNCKFQFSSMNKIYSNIIRI